jgi:hypothetical protein
LELSFHLQVLIFEFFCCDGPIKKAKHQKKKVLELSFHSQLINRDHNAHSICIITNQLISPFLLKKLFKLFKKLIFLAKRTLLYIFRNNISHMFLKINICPQKSLYHLYITFSSQTPHALQPLNVSCLKLLKITFKKEKNNAITKNIYKKTI